MIEEFDFSSDGMEFASEMVMSAAVSDLRIEEGPIVYHEREGEEPLDSLQDGRRHVKFISRTPSATVHSPRDRVRTARHSHHGGSMYGETIANLYFGTYTMLGGVSPVLMGYPVGSLGVFSSVAVDPIREQSDPIMCWISENVDLEDGATAGVLVFAAGGVAAAYMIAEWIRSGYTAEPSFAALVVAFTAILLGVQTVFYSFFLSMLAERNG